MKCINPQTTQKDDFLGRTVASRKLITKWKKVSWWCWEKMTFLFYYTDLEKVWNNFNAFGTLGKELAKEIGDICVKLFIALPDTINRYPNICSVLSSMDLKERW